MTNKTPPPEPPFEQKLASYLADLQRWRGEIEQARIVVESVNTFAVLAIKSLMLVSGAAAVAMLAFIGHIASNPVDGRMFAVGQLIPSLTAFGSTALLAAFAAGAAYLSQVAYTEFGRFGTGIGHVCRIVAVVAVLLGYGLFMWALLDAATAFESLRIVDAT
jgi:hypothetical protein